MIIRELQYIQLQKHGGAWNAQEVCELHARRFCLGTHFLNSYIDRQRIAYIFYVVLLLSQVHKPDDARHSRRRFRADGNTR